MEARFRDVRFFASVFKVIGWIVLGLGTLLACGILGLSFTGSTLLSGFGGDESGALGGLAVAIWGLTVFMLILLYTVVTAGALIILGGFAHILTAIEENTRGFGISQRITPAPSAATPPSATPPPSRPTVIR